MILVSTWNLLLVFKIDSLRIFNHRKVLFKILEIYFAFWMIDIKKEKVEWWKNYIAHTTQNNFNKMKFASNYGEFLNTHHHTKKKLPKFKKHNC